MGTRTVIGDLMQHEEFVLPGALWALVFDLNLQEGLGGPSTARFRFANSTLSGGQATHHRRHPRGHGRRSPHHTGRFWTGKPLMNSS